MIGQKNAQAIGPTEQSRAAYIGEALGLTRPAKMGFSEEFGPSAEDELLWTSVLALDEKNARRALAAGADVRKRRCVEREGGATPKKMSLFQAWLAAIKKNPEKAIAGRAAPVLLAIEEGGGLDLDEAEHGEPSAARRLSRKDRRLRDVGAWKAAWPRGARASHSRWEGDAREVAKDEAMSSALLGVIEHWVKDPGADSISLSEVARVAVEERDGGAVDRGCVGSLALMEALESRFGQLFGAEDWAAIAMRPGWSPALDSVRQVVDGAIRALAGSAANVDPWAAGWLASLGIMADCFALVEGVVRRAPAMHWRVPQEALAWLDLPNLWPGGAAEPGDAPVSLVHLALLYAESEEGDVAKALLANPVFAQGACENPLPSFWAFCDFKRYELLVDEFPGLGASGVDGENVAHAWAKLMAKSGAGAAGKMFDSRLKPLLESRFAELAVQKNARGETAAELFEAALIACGASAGPWREAFAKWEKREVAAAALAARNGASGGHRL